MYFTSPLCKTMIHVLPVVYLWKAVWGTLQMDVVVPASSLIKYVGHLT